MDGRLRDSAAHGEAEARTDRPTACRALTTGGRRPSFTKYLSITTAI